MPAAPSSRSRLRASAALAGVAAVAAVLATTAAPAAAKPRPVDLQILSFNDYHGHLEPPSGNELRARHHRARPGRRGGVPRDPPADLRQGKTNTLTVAAGDLIGGSPFLSGLFHDEPTVESLNALGLDVTSVGNHEFDEGITELLRMQYGGCHPTDGCYDPDGYAGADFPWLAANVDLQGRRARAAPADAHDYGSWFSSRTGRTVLPPTWVKKVTGIKVGFIGMTLEGTPELVAQAGIKDVDFNDEVATANLAAQDLRRRRASRRSSCCCTRAACRRRRGGLRLRCNAGGAAAHLRARSSTSPQNLDPSIDLVVTGHTHQPYTCNIPDPAGKPAG